jgi:hypothetical protein
MCRWGLQDDVEEKMNNKFHNVTIILSKLVSLLLLYHANEMFILYLDYVINSDTYCHIRTNNNVSNHLLLNTNSFYMENN